MIGKITSLRCLVCSSLICAVAEPASTQTVRESVAASARDQNLGHGFASIGVFGGTPGVSAARFYSDMDLNSTKLPLSHRFGSSSDEARTIAPYAEFTLGYVKATQDLSLVNDTAVPTKIDLRYNVWTGLAGAGLDIPVATSTTIRPIFLISYSRIDGKGKFSGPFADEFREGTRGILSDMYLDTVLMGGAVELGHRRSLKGDVRLSAKLRYNFLTDISSQASDPSLMPTGSFGVATGAAEFNGPTRVKLFGRNLRWLAFTSGTAFIGSQDRLFGFNSFVELGGGVELVASDVVGGVQGVTLRGSGIVGDNVTGWSIGVALAF